MFQNNGRYNKEKSLRQNGRHYRHAGRSGRLDSGGETMANNCEECVHFDDDDEIEAYFCSMDLDEDEMERFLRSENNACPFYRRGDDYLTARRQ